MIMRERERERERERKYILCRVELCVDRRECVVRIHTPVEVEVLPAVRVWGGEVR